MEPPTGGQGPPPISQQCNKKISGRHANLLGVLAVDLHLALRDSKLHRELLQPARILVELLLVGGGERILPLLGHQTGRACSGEDRKELLTNPPGVSSVSTF